jgi:TM2 domain-containing membrane protein YozV
MTRIPLLAAGHLIVLAVLAGPAPGQWAPGQSAPGQWVPDRALAVRGRPAPAAAAPVDSAPTARGRKSPVAAAVLGLVLPGAGHWYAGERGRGTLVAAVYWAGVAVIAGGRTDRVGHAGGAAVVGALAASIIDGARAAGRANARRAAAAPP